ncbi:MAG: DPP IV N-terminal domain-containing protein [Phycisphaeraceae bacterium]
MRGVTGESNERATRRALRIGCLGVMLLAMVGCTSRFYHSPVATDGPTARTRTAAAPRAADAAAPSREAGDDVRFRRPAEPAATDSDTDADASASAPRLADAESTVPGSALSGLGMFGRLDSIDRDGHTDPGEGTDNLKRITYAREGADFDPAVSPDGERLVFASTRHRQTEDLYVKTVDGSTITQLTDDPARDVMPAFSPDGQRIAFASDRAGTWDIYVMDAAGGQAMQITDDRHHNIHPTFSPDGERLVYSSYSTSAGQWQMVVVALDRPSTRHYIGPGLFPTWAPNADSGDRILFQRARQRGTRWFSIWTVPLDASGEAGSPTEIVASTNAAVITPDWGPDGDHIVFCTVSDPGADDQQGTDANRAAASGSVTADIWVVRADGTGQSRLTGGEFANLQPTWASDGTIYFVSNRGGEGVENIWALRPDEALHLATPEADAPGSSAAARR